MKLLISMKLRRTTKEKSRLHKTENDGANVTAETDVGIFTTTAATAPDAEGQRGHLTDEDK
ncbi:hypothetical protein Hanom_Chr15g01392331 [Helianthus anomalus]